MLIPTFLAESAQDRLARQAEDAESSTAAQKSAKEERLPEAAKLPLWLREDILSEVKDCQSACNDYADSADGNEWVDEYFTADGKIAQSRCAKKLVSVPERDECAIAGLKSCTETCTAELDETTISDPTSDLGKQTCLGQAKLIKQKGPDDESRPDSCEEGQQIANGEDGWTCVAELGDLTPDLYSDSGCKAYLEKQKRSLFKPFCNQKGFGLRTGLLGHSQRRGQCAQLGGVLLFEYSQ